MTVEELISTYHIILKPDGNLSAAIRHDIPAAERNAIIAELRSRKEETVAYLRAEQEEQDRKFREREAKIKAIPGLEELKAARADISAWHDEFDASFDDARGAGVGGLGVRPRPKYDFQAMREKYPAAAAYLRAEHEANSANYELADIGNRALESIINDYTQYAEIMARMDDEITAFTDRHMWD